LLHYFWLFSAVCLSQKSDLRGVRDAVRGIPRGLFTITAEGRAVAAIATLPTGRTGQLLALAILCLVLGGVYLLLVSPILDLCSQREATLADRRMLAPRLSVAAAELPELRARLAELQASATTRNIALDGASDAIAAANLQSRIEELAKSAGVTISSTEGLAGENRGAYRRVGLRLAISGEYEAIIKLLAAIETAAPPPGLEQCAISRRAAADRSVTNLAARCRGRGLWFPSHRYINLREE